MYKTYTSLLCIHTYMYLNVHVSAYMYLWYIYKHTYTQICGVRATGTKKWNYIHIHMMCIHTYISKCIYIHISTQTTCIYTCIYIYTYVYIERINNIHNTYVYIQISEVGTTGTKKGGFGRFIRGGVLWSVCLCSEHVCVCGMRALCVCMYVCVYNGGFSRYSQGGVSCSVGLRCEHARV